MTMNCFHHATLAFCLLALTACSGSPSSNDSTTAPEPRTGYDVYGSGEQQVDASNGSSSAGNERDASSIDHDAPTATGAPGAPVLALIGDRIVAVGETLNIVLTATDGDDVDLSFSVYGQLPDGATFDKLNQTFEWTPTEAGVTVFLTFVVSDGAEFDRETVRIEVVADKTDHPPAFQVVGDQIVVAGALFTLLLEASDPDGDTLSYGFEGALPAGSSLDPDSGLFSWTASSDLIGESYTLTFTVSDGSLTDAININLSVQEEGGSGGGQSPPVFAAIGAQSVAVNETLTFVISAVDGDGDKLTYDVYSNLPPAAELDVSTFSWTPQPDQLGLTYTVTFSATDGTFTAYMNVDITVLALPAGSCVDDSWEPNESTEAAHELGAGVFNGSICDTELVPIDLDYFKLSIPPESTLQATITFDTTYGDLDLYLINEDLDTLMSSETSFGIESVTWPSPGGEDVYLLVVGFGQPVFASSFELTVTFNDELPAQCEPDIFEPNDNASTAKPLAGQLNGLSICLNDMDIFWVDLLCGERLDVTMDVQGFGDLDLALWQDGSLSSDPVAVASTSDAIETLTLESSPSEGLFYLQIVSYPLGEAWSPYSLQAARSGGCIDDLSKGNSSPDEATYIAGNDGLITNQVICCEPDWYALVLGDNQQAIIEATVNTGTVSLAVFASDGTSLISDGGASTTASSVDLESGAEQTFYLRVLGTTDATYDIEWITIGGSAAQCSSSNDCPKYKVCDPEIGTCVTDVCFVDGDCPAAHACMDTYCVSSCATNSDCRVNDGYQCKEFEAGTYCGLTGDGGVGTACSDHVDCEAASVCLFQQAFGYCSLLGCASPLVSCPIFSICTETQDLTFCAKSCQTDAQCRTEDGYTCKDGTCLL